MLVLALGFLFAVFFAWAFEVTPEGLKRESDVDRSESVTHVTGRKLNRAITALLVIALGYFIWEARIADRPMPDVANTEVPQAAEQGDRKSIAVLPFDNRSSREEDEYFTEGIHDDLLTTISKIGSMKVISRTSVMAYRDTTRNLRDIAQELGVNNILEGGVQRSGNQVRINVQLIDAATDEHLWAEIYDRELTAGNLFTIQSEITAAIADALQATLSPEEQVKVKTVGTQNLEAYESYLLGRQQLLARLADSVLESEKHFRRAVELDPEFALAWVGLSDAYRFSVSYANVLPAEAHPKAEQAVNAALAIDAELGEAYASRADLKARTDREAEAETDFKLAIKFAPNYADAHHWYGILLLQQQRFDEAIAAYRRSLELDPLSTSARVNLAGAYEREGRFDDALQLIERVVEIDPDGAQGQGVLALHYYTARGQTDNALMWVTRAVQNDPQGLRFFLWIVTMYADLGDFDTAEAWLDAMDLVRPGSFASDVGWHYCALLQGETERATELSYQLENRFEGFGGSLPKFPLVFLRDVDIKNGRYKDAVARFEASYPDLVNVESPRIDHANADVAEDLAYLYLSAGDDSRADLLLESVIPYVQEQPFLGRFGSRYGNARSYALLGRTEAALEELHRGVEAGWRIYWLYLFDYDPIIEPLRGDPRFRTLRAKIAADMSEQLVHVRELEASGDIMRPEKFMLRLENKD